MGVVYSKSNLVMIRYLMQTALNNKSMMNAHSVLLSQFLKVIMVQFLRMVKLDVVKHLL
jgi:hypothetical protein